MPRKATAPGTYRSASLVIALTLLSVTLLSIARHAGAQSETPSAGAAATNVSGVISADTVWSASQSPYNLTGKVQVASGVTLTVEPGAVVQGNGFSLEIFGTLSAVGNTGAAVQFQNALIVPGGSGNGQALIDVEFADINGGGIYAVNGSPGAGRLILRDSLVRNTQTMYVWYPSADSYIERNRFVGAGGISVGMSGVTVYIRNNAFYQTAPSVYAAAAVECWNGTPVVERNSFLSTDRLAVGLPKGYMGARIDARNNYWNTADPAVIAGMIFDKNDDLNSADYVAFQPFLTSPDPATPSIATPTPTTTPTPVPTPTPTPGVTNVGGIISANTTWSAAQSPYYLTGKVQVASGVTLTMEPGVTVQGNGALIEVFGTLSAVGSSGTPITFQNTRIGPGSSGNGQAFIDLEFSEINGGGIYPVSGNPGHGRLTLRDSAIRNTETMYVWYPSADSYIERNRFVGAAGISLGTSGGVTVYIRNNAFYQTAPSVYASAAVECWNGTPVVERNSFLSTDRVAVSLPKGYTGPRMDARNNYWNTADPAVIAGMIFDKNDDLNSADFIAFQPFLTSPDPATPVVETRSPTSVSNVSGAGVYNGVGTLAATLTSGGLPLPNQAVNFTLNGVAAGSAITNMNGVARLANVSLAGLNAGAYQSAVSADFVGGPNHTGSSASGALTVGKGDQTINFGAQPDKVFGDPEFAISATASSGLPVTYATAGNCTVSGSIVRITGAGACTVTASQVGSSNYNPAANVTQSFLIDKAATSTAVTTSAAAPPPGQSVTFTAVVTSAAGTPSGAVQFKADGAALGAPAAVNAGGVATLTTTALAPGVHAVTAEYSGDSNHKPSVGALAGGQSIGANFQFAQGLYTASERDRSLTITVRRVGDLTPPASVDYSTEDGSSASVAVPCSSVTGIALERCDYTGAAGTLNFNASESEKSFVVLLSDDSYDEGSETAHVRLSNPSAGAAVASQSTATMQITDNATVTHNPVDDSEAFVRQHYHDFLGRVPDSSGLKFWTDEIEGCGLDSACREVKRVNVSAAFFLSIEFQQTGYLVERLYKSAYGDATGTFNDQQVTRQVAVPVVRLQEFLPDTQKIGRGVVVGEGDWQGQLESNKRAFALEFVRRQRFQTAFPSGMAPDQFVGQLDANAGGVLTPEEKTELATVLGSEPADAGRRAHVLLKVAENQTLQRREFSRAFVLMQFFGYLRRNPNDAPDADHGGYIYWLSKLNEFDGNFINAEMVKAFISATEFRGRFGQ